MSHAVLYLGGPFDGVRAVVDELRPIQVVADWDSLRRDAVRVVYQLEEVRDGSSGLVRHVYVRHGLNTLAQLLHGYREAQS